MFLWLYNFGYVTLVVKEGGGLTQFLTPKPKIFQVKKVKVPNQLKLNFVDQAHSK